MMKKEKGITLIALIITIIILIILSGIVIVSITGENGMIKRAKQASSETIEGEVRDEVLMMLSEYQIDRNIDGIEMMEYFNKKSERGEIDDVQKSGEGIYEIYIKGFKVTIEEKTPKIIKMVREEYSVVKLAYEKKRQLEDKLIVKVILNSINQGISKVECPDGSIKEYSGEMNVEFEYSVEGEKEYIFKTTTVDDKLSSSRLYINVVKFKQINVGKGLGNNIAIDEKGNIWVWGYNSNGELGDGTKNICKYPKKLQLDVKFQEVGLTNSSGIGLDIEGNIWIWGRNSYGLLGKGHTNDNEYQLNPEKLELGVKFTDIKTSPLSVMALDENGNIWTWGGNNEGQLGNGTKVNSGTPSKVNIGVKIKNIFNPETSTSYVVEDENGDIWGWGGNSNGRLGNGNKTNILVPQIIPSLKQFKEIVIGSQAGLGIDEKGQLYAWGGGMYGARGDGINDINNCILEPQKSDFSTELLKLGHYGEICNYAIDKELNLWSWGYGGNGQLGNGETKSYYIPQKVKCDAKFQQILGANQISMGLDTENNIWTWGYASESTPLGYDLLTNSGTIKTPIKLIVTE